MPSRCYFIDALTNEEIDCEWNGWFPAAEDAAGASPRTGVQYTDTMWSIRVTRGPRSSESRSVTAADFPGRLVKVKIWCSGGGRPVAEFRVLITEAMGFVGLDKAQARGEMSRDSYGRPFRQHVRAEILTNRAALKHMAANAPRESAAA
jgi:hypothetical protein